MLSVSLKAKYGSGLLFLGAGHVKTDIQDRDKRLSVVFIRNEYIYK